MSLKTIMAAILPLSPLSIEVLVERVKQWLADEFSMENLRPYASIHKAATAVAFRLT
jgi:hypothetical protein